MLYGALIASLAVAWLVPQESLLALPAIPRFLAASALAFAPVYLANLVFAQRFADVHNSGRPLPTFSARSSTARSSTCP